MLKNINNNGMKKVLKISLIILLTLFVISLAISITFITIVKKEISQISIDKELLLNQTTQIMVYDNENNVISNSNYEGKKLVNIGEIPEYVKQAFISIEDKNFYNHNGVNYKRILKALYNNIKSHKIVEGASTITQQLVKNTHLTTEKTFKRKIKEIYLAKKIEDAYSKDEILELYLNVIYFGNGNYGIENASNYYFGVSASELTINQAAVLAGMIKSPKNYDPLNNCENCKKRRNLVLKEMLKDGKITNDIYQESINKEIKVVDNKDSIDNNSQYVKASISEACKILNTTEQNIAFNNYKIFTYYDDDVQSTLVETINNNDYYEKNEHGNIADGLGIVINNNTGGIEAFAGKSNYNLSNVKRQPGSAIKPILVYAPALDNGTISPMTQLLDESINIDGYTPHNVGGDNHGYISATQSVAKSLNIPAIKTMQYVGIDKCKSFAERAGIEFSEKDKGLAIALGGFTDGTTLQTLAASYLPFARNGNYVQNGFIRKITTSQGIVVYQKDEIGTQIMGDDTAYLMTNMLIDSVQTGTSKRLKNLPFEVAGKTGTVAVKGTNYNTDAISIAYTTNHIVGTTLFDYSNDKDYYLSSTNNGGTYATSMIKEIFENIYKNNPKPSDFIVPDSVCELEIDSDELTENHVIKLATNNTPPKLKIKGYFANRFMPTSVSERFDNPQVDFNVQYLDNKAVISAKLNKNFNYELIKGNEIIDVIEDYDKVDYMFTDNNLKDNQMYEYYFRIMNPYTLDKFESNKISIITKSKYQSIIDNEIAKKSISWYFG